MALNSDDDRTAERLARDEAIVAAPLLPPPDLPAGAKPVALEVLLRRAHKPIAVAGVVENGVVRPLDPAVRLPERARVIIVATKTA
jgi:hypothetical protein